MTASAEIGTLLSDGVNWQSLAEGHAYVRMVCSCDLEKARDKIRGALAAGLWPLRWEDASAGSPQGDLPPRGGPHWLFVEIDWDAGTVLDDFSKPRQALGRHRQLSIHRLGLDATLYSKVKTVKLGKRTLVDFESLDELGDSLPAAG
jgi:hypothetical protein